MDNATAAKDSTTPNRHAILFLSSEPGATDHRTRQRQVITSFEGGLSIQERDRYRSGELTGGGIKTALIVGTDRQSISRD